MHSQRPVRFLCWLRPLSPAVKVVASVVTVVVVTVVVVTAAATSIAAQVVVVAMAFRSQLLVPDYWLSRRVATC